MELAKKKPEGITITVELDSSKFQKQLAIMQRCVEELRELDKAEKSK